MKDKQVDGGALNLKIDIHKADLCCQENSFKELKI